MRYLVAGLMLMLTLQLVAQSPEGYRHRILLEAGGNGGLWSLNYERDFKRLLPRHLKGEAGFSFMPLGSRVAVIFPFSLNFTLGKDAHKAEFGTGQIFMLSLGDSKGGAFRGNFQLGYRYQPPDKRLFFKVGYTPFYSYLINFQFEHWLGIGMGYQFSSK